MSGGARSTRYLCRIEGNDECERAVLTDSNVEVVVRTQDQGPRRDEQNRGGPNRTEYETARDTKTPRPRTDKDQGPTRTKDQQGPTGTETDQRPRTRKCKHQPPVTNKDNGSRRTEEDQVTTKPKKER